MNIKVTVEEATKVRELAQKKSMHNMCFEDYLKISGQERALQNTVGGST